MGEFKKMSEFVGKHPGGGARILFVFDQANPRLVAGLSAKLRPHRSIDKKDPHTQTCTIAGYKKMISAFVQNIGMHSRRHLLDHALARVAAEAYFGPVLPNAAGKAK
jgi:hypothetical protein